MEKLILVIEKPTTEKVGPIQVPMGVAPEADNTYRSILTRGVTYTPQQFADWVTKNFVPKSMSDEEWEELTLEEMAELAAKGGWECYQRL